MVSAAPLRLEWSQSEDSFGFSVTRPGLEGYDLDSWAQLEVCTGAGARAQVGVLVRLLDSDLATWNEANKSLDVPAAVVAGLTAGELQGLGLPPFMPFTLEVESTGAPTDPDYRIRYWFLDPRSSRRLVAPVRSGALLQVGDGRFLIPAAVLSVVEAADALNEGVEGERTKHLEALAAFQAQLPKEVRLGSHFGSIRLARAGVLALAPFVNQSGEPDFDPVLMAQPPDAANPAEASPAPLELLPRAAQQTWAQLFRRRRRVPALQPAGDGWIAIVPEPVRLILEAVREIQSSSPHVRRAFLENPQGVIKERLAGVLEAEAVEDLLFETTAYSSRVKEIGVWEPRVLPYLRAAGKEWLPPEVLGVRIGNQEIPIPKEELDVVLEEVRNAIEGGAETVEVAGVTLPASGATISALEQLVIRRAQPVGEAKKELRNGQLALLILDNLDDLEFSAPGETPPPVERWEVGESIRTPLLRHQLEGLRWLQTLWSRGRRGALLADDMGLGKTLQALAFLSWVNAVHGGKRDGRKPILVVGPTGLLRNWLAEHDQHLAEGGLGDFLEAHGAGIQSLRLAGSWRGPETSGGLPALDVSRLRQADWVLTTYETLRDYQHSFGRVEWRAMVLDEAQRVKNPQALVSNATKAMNSRFTVALTGTPVENRLSDLWSIIDTIQPGLLGSLKDFSSEYEAVSVSGMKLQGLKEKLTRGDAPVMLRRMKEGHLEGLPELKVHVERRTMPAAQEQEYDAIVAKARSGQGAPGVLAALHELRAVSLHPWPAILGNEDEFIQASARWSYAFEVLERIHARGEKALIFLDSLVHQAGLAELLQRRFGLAAPPLIINGSVPGSKRKARVDEFQTRAGFDAMILSSRAGGVGLTLTAANHVIHLSRWWNPAVEDQCSDRVFRIGQKRTVHVYVPLAIHLRYPSQSFDARLDELLREKRTLSRTVLAPATTTEEDMKRLYGETVLGGPDAAQARSES